MLSSTLLIAGMVLISAGALAGAMSPKLGVIGMGSGSVAMGIFLLSDVPEGFEIHAAIFFGSLVLIGIWMFAVGIKEQGW
jgi:hypothetical protein